MKAILIIGALAVLAILLFAACSAAALPPGPNTEKTLALAGGEYSIVAGGPVSVITIAENGLNTAVLSGGANYLERIQFTVNESLKEIRVAMNYPGSFSYRGEVTLAVGAAVNSIDISGSVAVDYRDATVSSFKLKASGSSKGNYTFAQGLEDLTVSASGSSRDSFACAGQLNSLEVRASGSSNFTFTGAVKQADYHLSGSGKIRAFDLTADTVTVRCSGSCDIEQGFAAGGRLTGSMSGSGRVTHTGGPSVDIKTSGSARISPRQ